MLHNVNQRRGIVVLLFVAVGLPGTAQNHLASGSPQELGFSRERLERLDLFLKDNVERKTIPGAVALVARKGKVAFLRSYGRRTGAEPMRPDALFQLASMTKPITAVATLVLMEEGKLLLSDPVSKYIPEFRSLTVAAPNAPHERVAGGYRSVPADREITVRDLLTHTSGLASGTSGPMGLYRDLAAQIPNGTPLAERVRGYAALPLNFQPGTAWEYSGTVGFDTLSRVVEVASGERLDRFFSKRIFEPLGMADTFFYAEPSQVARLADMYSRRDGALQKVTGIRASPTDAARTFFSGAGNLVSSAEDYAVFAQMLLNRGSYGGKRIVSRKAIEMMASNAIGDLPVWTRETGNQDMNGYRFGYGVQVRQSTGAAGWLGSEGSFGWGGAFGTLFWVDPREELIAVLMIPVATIDLWYQFPNLVYAALE